MAEYRKKPIVIGNDGNLEEVLDSDPLCYAIERLGDSSVFIERRYTLSTHTIPPNSPKVAITSLTFDPLQYNGLKVNYILKRGTSSVRMGTMLVASDGVDASLSFYDTEIGFCGVEFSVDIQDNKVFVYWESDNTANNITARFETTLYKL